MVANIWTQMNVVPCLCLLVLVVCFQVEANAIKGPPTAAQKELTKVAKLGDDIKIICPMTGYPNPMIAWSKGDEAINSYAWVRFRPNKKSLKIKSVMIEDAGAYLCKGTNGFGSEEIKVNLIVIDPVDFPNLAEGEIPDVSPPSFVETILSLPSTYRRETNGLLRIPCEARAKPEAQVQWLHFNPEFRNPQILEQRPRMATLTISNLLKSDSGMYGCIARNQFGEVARNFTLEVEGPMALEKPVLTSGSENATVEQGKKATLECKVQSSSSFLLKWLKKYTGSEIRSDIIDLGTQKFQVIQNNSESISNGQDEYINTLVIPNAQQEDAGMYVCIVTSSHGYDFKNVFLNVTTVPTSPNALEHDPLLIAVVCVSALAFVILIAIIYRVCRKGPLIGETSDVQENLMRQQEQKQQQQQQQIHSHQPQQAPPPPQPAARSQPNQYHFQHQPQYQANVNNNRNMNIHINKLDQPLPPPPPPPSLHNEGSTASNNLPWGVYPDYPASGNMMNYTDSSSSTKYNGGSGYGGPQNEYEVPHVNTLMGMRSKNQAIGAPANGHSSGYGSYNQPSAPSPHQPIYPYRSQQYGFYDD